MELWSTNNQRRDLAGRDMQSEVVQDGHIWSSRIAEANIVQVDDTGGIIWLLA